MSQQPYEFSLGPEGGTKIFHTLKEIEDWLNEERKFWTNFEQAGSRDRELSNCWQPFRQFFGHVSQQLTTAKDSEQSAQQDKREFDPTPFLNSLKNQFQQAYETEKLIVSTSPRAKFLQRMAESDGVAVAVYAAGYFMEQDIPLDRNHTKTLHDCLRGALAASYHEHGFTERIADEKQSLQELRGNWEKTFQAFEKSLLEETEKHQKLNAEAGELLDKQKSEFAELIKKETNAWEALHKTYDDKLSLQKPVQYWTNKAKRHLCLSWAFGIAAAFVAGGVSWAVYDLLQITLKIPANVKDSATWHPEYWRVGVLIGAGLLGAWIVRIFVRLFLSHVHLLTDARERAIMVQTYLALLRKGAITEKERELILAVLFRPAATGIVKDDAMPLTLVEAATRLGKS